MTPWLPLESLRVLGELRARGPATTRELAERLGLSHNQVKDAFIHEGQSLPRGRRHPPRPKPAPKRAKDTGTAAKSTPAPKRPTSLSSKFTPEEQAAIREAEAAGKVTRIEQGEFEDTDRLNTWRGRPRGPRNGGEWHRAQAVRRRAADVLEV